MRTLIVGCGYVGLPLGVELRRRGHQVVGVRRSAESAAELARSGIEPLALDITRREELAKITGPFDWIVNTVSSSKGGLSEYRAVYLEATQHLIQWLAAQPPRRYVHTGSTSVYAQVDGSWVTENSLTEPATETSRVLLETERLLLDAASETGFPAALLRVAGIYGPERGHLFHQFLRGEATLRGDGSRWLNMIHRDDLVTAILAALERGQAGAIYNVADDEPVTEREFFGWLSDQLARPMPPTAQSKSAPRKRALTHKRVANGKLRLALRCELKYPSFRQGYAAEIARLQAAGQLPARVGQ